MALNLSEAFENHNDEYLKFDRVADPISARPDLHAFMLLDRLQAGNRDMIGAAGHDEIWLDVDTDKLAEIITDEQVRDLVRCGVRYDSDADSLAMFA